MDDPGYVRAFATFVRRHPRVRFIGFFNGPAEAPTHRDEAAEPGGYRQFVVPLDPLTTAA